MAYTRPTKFFQFFIVAAILVSIPLAVFVSATVAQERCCCAQGETK